MTKHKPLIFPVAVLFSVCRALFAYDGIMNRLKLADSGGKSIESFMFLCVLELALMPFLL